MLYSLTNRSQDQDGGGRLSISETSQLSELALQGLAAMFDPESQLFCFRLKQCDSRMVRDGLSRRYTIIALLGLRQREAAGLQSPVDIKRVLEQLLEDTAWIDNVGDLSLLLWLCALVFPEQLKEICSNLGVAGALTRFRDAREERTMEIAWLLSGLAHTVLATAPDAIPDLTPAAVKCYEILKKNQGGGGFFGHLSKRKTLAGRIRGRVGSFADQVYPIYALTKFAEAYKKEAALDMANVCAEAICRAQGPLGQWWWHYDSETGIVAERYPVYSVHQHGMAPMALLALSRARRKDLSSAISKGLAWLAGSNELGFDFRDSSSKVIWRSAYPAAFRHRLEMPSSLLTRRNNFTPPGQMTMKWECRPYELGWLLYAFPSGGPVIPSTHL